MAIECPKCKTVNTYDSEFCKKCATPLPSSKEISASPTKTLETPIKEFTRGTTFAKRYEFIEELGMGGMGRVYKVFDKTIKEEVAIKLLKPEISDDEKIIERFSNELKFARKIVHKNVGRMYDISEENGTYFITMEYVPGEDLKRFIRRSGQLTVGKAVSIAKQVCEGLAEAHKLGVVHRDLKPGNIMIDTDGNARIMDFGIARSMKTKGVTGAGFVVGTPEYMSPEQVEGKEVDKRSDIYSLGVIIFEMLTGRVPFEGDTPFSVAFKHKSEPPPDPRELNAQIPDELCDVILKCLEKDKGERYQKTGELISDLASIDEEIPTTERVLPKKKTRAIKKKRPSFGLRKVFIPLLSIIFLAAVAFVALKLVRKSALELTAEPISVMVVDFENRTGDPDFDLSLAQALCSGLGEAPFISRIFSPSQARQVANQLDPEAKGQLSENLIQRISEREAIDVIIRGLIVREGSGYSIKVSASNPVNSESLADITEQLVIKAEWQRAMSNLAENLQSSLREQRFRASSLEAMNAYARAEEYRAVGEIVKAIKEYQRAIKKDPEHAQSYISLSTLFYQRGQYDEAKEYFREAYNRRGEISEREKHKSFGAYYAMERDFPKAIQEFRALISKYPADPVGYTNLALANFYARDYESALEIARQWIGMNPEDRISQYNLTWYALIAGKFSVAEEEAQKLLDLSPEYIDAYVCLALSELAQEKNTEAEETYQQLKELSPYGASLAAIGLADIALYEGRLNAAKDILEEGIEKDKEEDVHDVLIANKQVILANTFLLMGQENLALDVLDGAKILIDTSKNAGLLYVAALAYLNAGQENKALGLASQIRKRAPESSAYAMLIEGESKIVRKERTKEALRRDLPEAIQMFKEANRIDDSWLGHFALGKAYLAAEEYVKAQREFDWCLERQGETTSLFMDDLPSYRYYPPLYLYLGLCQQSKNNPEALDSYKKFLDIKSEGEDDALVRLAKQRQASLIQLVEKTEKGILESISVLIADFQNQTDDPVFDGALEQAFGLGLDAPFIAIYDRAAARKLMKQLSPDDDKLDVERIRFLCAREGINVIIAGSIEPKDDGYVIKAQAIDPVTSKNIVEGIETVNTKAGVLQATDVLASKLRSEIIGTPLDSTQTIKSEKFTTTSLEALSAYNRAQELVSEGKQEEAINEYLRTIQEDPRFGRAYSGLAIIYLIRGEFEKGREYLRQALTHIDTMTEREKYRTRCMWYGLTKDYQKIIEESIALLEISPEDSVAHGNLSFAYFMVRNIPKAAEYGKIMAAINPKNVITRYNLSWYALGAGDFELAKQEANKTLELDPNFELAYITLALSELGLEQSTQAEMAYEHLKTMSSTGSSLGTMGLADIALYEGRLERAKEILQEGIEADFKDNRSDLAAHKMVMLAQTHLILGENDLALKLTDQAYAERKEIDVLVPVSLFYSVLGRVDQAVSIASELDKKLESEPRAYSKLIRGELSRVRGDLGKAVSLFHEAKALMDTWIGRFLLGRAYIQAEDWTAAHSEFELCLIRRGEAASVYFNDHPSFYYFPQVYYYLGRALEGLGSPAAKDAYMRFLKIKEKSDGSSPMIEDTRRRLSNL